MLPSPDIVTRSTAIARASSVPDGLCRTREKRAKDPGGENRSPPVKRRLCAGEPFVVYDPSNFNAFDVTRTKSDIEPPTSSRIVFSVDAIDEQGRNEQAKATITFGIVQKHHHVR